MFIGPPKLVFIKTTEAGPQGSLRPGAPKILVAQAPAEGLAATVATPTAPAAPASTTTDESLNETQTLPRILRRHATEKKYGKRQKTAEAENEEAKDSDNASETSSELPVLFIFYICVIQFN